jgi:hypothetical protein
MIEITSKRIKGSGKGEQMKFPTINFILDKLPNGLEQGLYATVGQLGRGVSLISIDKGKYRIETHIINAGDRWNNKITVNVGSDYNIKFLDKLRDPKRTRDIENLIKGDLDLAKDYFDKFKTCLSCQLCYIQDYGYSNYTVEGSDIGCYADVFGEVEYDSYYSEEVYNSYGCKYMSPGEHWDLDVDGENEKPSDQWIKSTVRDIKLDYILNKKK